MHLHEKPIFQKFIDGRKSNVGLMTYRLLQGLENFNTSEVDCWVHTENLEADYEYCLRKFAAQGGYVPPHTISRAGDASTRYKLDPNRRTNCLQYYDKRHVDMIEMIDSHLYETFGYHHCCDEAFTIRDRDRNV